MGWQADEGLEHEGYLVAIEQHAGAWRELGYELPWNPKLAAGEWHPVTTVQAGCECGWRSPRFAAPVGTTWAPYTVDAPEHCEDRARALWLEHLKDLRNHQLVDATPAVDAAPAARPTLPVHEVAVTSSRRRGEKPRVVDLDQNSRRIVALARSFPSLRDAFGLEPWDPFAFAAWLRSGAATSGSAHAGRFVLAVWGGDNRDLVDPHTFALGGFDAAAAFHAWDRGHIDAFRAWTAEPWFP